MNKFQFCQFWVECCDTCVEIHLIFGASFPLLVKSDLDFAQ